MSRARPVSKVPGGKALNKIGLQAGCRTGRPKKDGAISRAQTGQGPPKFDRSLAGCVLREGIQPASRPAQLKRTFYTESLNYLQMYSSEEHTSELQSRGHLVCRLLLEKKKNTQNTTMQT